MIDPTCDRENAVLAAIRRGGLDEAARAHVAGCAACALALEAERATKELAAVFAAEARLAPVEVVALRARLRARSEETERSLRPLELWQRFAGVAVAAGLLVAGILSGPMFGALGAAPAGVDPKLALLALGVGSLLTLPFAGRRRIA
jgi:hypothetical protein